MSRLLLPPLPLPLLLLLSLLLTCLHQTAHCEATASDSEESALTDGAPPMTDGAPVSVKGSPAVCSAGQYSLLGRCHRQRGAGTLCLSDSWCRSGRCRLGLCRRGTADCRSGRPACGTGQQCVSEPDGWRCRAEDGTLALGAACSLDSECASGTCSAEGDAAGTCGCPADFTACAGHCYKAAGAFQIRTGATDVCRLLGTILATPRSVEEENCLWSVVAAQSIEAGGIWLGYTRSGDGTEEFIGEDGLPITYTNWAHAPDTSKNSVGLALDRLWYPVELDIGSIQLAICQI